MNSELIIMAVLLGAGLAMDAFSVSLANGLADRKMNKRRMTLIAGTFAGFQMAMPLIGWFLVHAAASRLAWFEGLVPWIAFFLLLYIGGKMLREGLAENRPAQSGADGQSGDGADGQSGNGADGQSGNGADVGSGKELTASALAMQGIATSIDALSVGFTIESYGAGEAFASALIIGAVTFAICFAGLGIGKKMGTVLSGKASILGGIILIGIGIEILVRGLLGI